MMNLNLMDIFILAVLGLSVISGMYKGFLSSMFAAFGFAGAFLGAMRLYPRLANAILSNNSLMDVLKYYLDAGNLFQTPALGSTPVANVVLDASVLNAAVNELSSLPSVLVEAFRSNVTLQLFESRLESGVMTPWLATFTDYLNHTIWASVVNVVSFIALFAALYLLALLLVNLLHAVFHFPGIKHFDWLLGGVFGAARGYVILLLILSILPMLLTTINLKEIDDILAASSLLPFFPANFAIPDIVKQTFQWYIDAAGH